MTSTLAFLRESWWPGPAVDFWHFVKLLNKRAAGREWWPLLVQEHGGHRLLFPKLLYLAEYAWFEGRNVFLISSSLLLQAVTAMLVIAGVWRERAQVGGPLCVLVGGLVVALLFSGAQVENFLRAWNLHWFLAHAASALAFAALVGGARRASERQRAAAAGWLGAAVLAGLVATWSMGNGLLVWPVLLALAWLLRLPGRALAALGAAAVLGVGSFFVGWEPHPNVAPGRLLEAPGVPLLWLLRALGTPLSAVDGMVAAFAGVFVLACAGLAGLDLLRRRDRLAPVEPLLAGLLLFAVGTLLLAATGRAASTWSEPRYQTTVLLSWAALLVQGLLRAGSSTPRRSLVAMSIALAWLLVPVELAHWQGLAATQPFVERMRAANLAIVVGIDHRPSYRVTLPFADRLRNRDRVQQFSPALRRRGEGMFADGHHELLGTRVDLERAERNRGACAGEVEQVERLVHPSTGERAGTRARGSLRSEDGRPPRAPLVLTDDHGEVIGLAVSDRQGHWTAFARPQPTPTPIHLLALGDVPSPCFSFEP